jgi:predicted secreted protein
MLTDDHRSWTIDLRSAEETNHLLVMKGGENFDILMDGIPTTGYKWENNIQFMDEHD